MNYHIERRHAATRWAFAEVEKLYADMRLCLVSPSEASYALRFLAVGLMVSGAPDHYLLAADMQFLAQHVLAVSNLPDERLPAERRVA